MTVAGEVSFGVGGTRLHDQTVEYLGRSIVQGVLPPGSSINPEKLGEHLGASRSVVREAFRALEAKGLVTARPKVGTRVADESRWDYLDPQVITWRLQGDERLDQVEELYSTRLAIEPVAARLVSLSSETSAIGGLSAILDRMQAAFESRDIHAFTEADVEFHTTLLALSGNRMFQRLQSVIATAVRTRETLVFPLVEETLHGLEVHRRLVAEIANGDPSVEQTSRTLIVNAQREAEVALGHWGTLPPAHTTATD
ncbi:FadR/GntR family transcriptional regulator [Herbiconiux ginsengi]|uniref:Transcriptional regulator, GntR family n=1 Tax=Herbiconiux ginsengi TaxID=381665 RepID=A0A1H3LJA2_9MICO|nr:FadR/GntR family transcriptional regulator [Herbiconiux ginsengi]SDY64024.1 transcriptional regulator, GntR family [Herbiconiux ginsengi]